MLRVITSENAQALINAANERGIEKKDIISLLDRQGQLILIYEVNT